MSEDPRGMTGGTATAVAGYGGDERIGNSVSDSPAPDYESRCEAEKQQPVITGMSGAIWHGMNLTIDFPTGKHFLVDDAAGRELGSL
jgi:hypothetical protein